MIQFVLMAVTTFPYGFGDMPFTEDLLIQDNFACCFYQFTNEQLTKGSEGSITEASSMAGV